MHIVSHALLKALLFLCAGALWEVHGTASNKELTGCRHPRWVAVLFLLGALGLGGAPPLPAFWSKFALFAAATRGGYGWAAGIGIGVSLLTITLLVRAGAHIFLEQTHAEGGEHGHDLAAADD
jgi:multicomponent Na+:H+ antiporter subunit D